MEDSVNNDSTKQLNKNEASDTEVSKQDDAVKTEGSVGEKVSRDAKISTENMENLIDMYEESFKRFREGEVVGGRIISVDKEYVLVDIGYKSEGQIRINEFKDEEGNINAGVGDRVEVMAVSIGA